MISKDNPKPKEGSSKINIDSDAVRHLSDLLKETDLSEIEYEADGCRIRVARQSYALPPQTFSASSIPPQASVPLNSSPSTLNHELHPGLVKSPMVGTVYLSPKPGDPPFVTVGATVSAGQTLMIIEAMKVMNPLKASKGGKVTQLLVEDGQPVEFDEPLLIIE